MPRTVQHPDRSIHSCRADVHLALGRGSRLAWHEQAQQAAADREPKRGLHEHVRGQDPKEKQDGTYYVDRMHAPLRRELVPDHERNRHAPEDVENRVTVFVSPEESSERIRRQQSPYPTWVNAKVASSIRRLWASSAPLAMATTAAVRNAPNMTMSLSGMNRKAAALSNGIPSSIRCSVITNPAYMPNATRKKP